MKRFSVIGAGNLGLHLIDSLAKKGYALQHIYKKSKHRQFDFALSEDLRAVVEKADFIVISTQESKIAAAAELVSAAAQLQGKIFFHTSNSLTSTELLSLKKKGAYVASCSPLQTFPQYESGAGSDVFKDIYFLAEGDQEAISLTRQVTADLGAKLLLVDKDEKIYFHIAGVAACNFLIAVLKLAEDQLKKVKNIQRHCPEPLDIKILLPLIRQTLENVSNRGVDASLTGPVKRKETGIIAKHLKALENTPEQAALYQALTAYLKKSGS